MALDKYEQIGAPNTAADTLTSTPIGTKGTPGSPPFALGVSGDNPPVAAARLSWYAITGASALPAPPP
jgi:hypothetical protein